MKNEDFGLQREIPLFVTKEGASLEIGKYFAALHMFQQI